MAGSPGSGLSGQLVDYLLRNGQRSCFDELAITHNIYGLVEFPFTSQCYVILYSTHTSLTN